MKTQRNRPAVFYLAVLLALLLAGCSSDGSSAASGAAPSKAGGAVSSVAETQPTKTENTFVSQDPEQSRPESNKKEIDLTVPEYIFLDVGETFQLEPESKGVEHPIFEYVAEHPNFIEVTETGLITLKTNAHSGVYIVLVDGDTGERILTKKVTVVSKNAMAQTSSEV